MAGKSVVDLLATTISCIDDEYIKRGILWRLTDENELSPDNFCELIRRAVKDKIGFYNNLDSFLVERKSKSRATEPEYEWCSLQLVAGTALSIIETIKSYKSSWIINDDEMCDIVNPVINFSRILEDTQFRGTAHRLLRHFGEVASDERRQRIFENRPDLSNEMKNAISEGAIKKNGGAYHVLTELEYRDHQGTANKSVFRTEIEKIQNEFEGAVQANNEDMKRVKFAKLRELMGVPEAEDWLREYYPQCVGWSFDY